MPLKALFIICLFSSKLKTLDVAFNTLPVTMYCVLMLELEDTTLEAPFSCRGLNCCCNALHSDSNRMVVIKFSD